MSHVLGLSILAGGNTACLSCRDCSTYLLPYNASFPGLESFSHMHA